MTDRDGFSPQALSAAIGTIYDCALDPDLWPDAFRQIAALCRSHSGGMCVHDLKQVHEFRLFEFGYPVAFSTQYQKHIDLSPFTALASVARIGEVATLGMLCSDRELAESRFYRELLKPFGYGDFIGFLALRTGNRIASVHASRTEEAPRYGEREIDLFRLIAPHVCRALAISDALDIRTLQSEMLEATLDGLAAGVYLAARDGRIVFMNAAAERQVKAGRALRIVDGRLAPTNQAVRAALDGAIDEATTDETEARRGRPLSLAIPDSGGAGYVATLLPLERGRRRNMLARFAASVAIFTRDPTEASPMPGAAFARLYQLTGSELRLLLVLAQGLDAREAAEMLSVSEATVRTHLQHMFSKTGTSRQVELLHLLQSSAPPLKVEQGAPQEG